MIKTPYEKGRFTAGTEFQAWNGDGENQVSWLVSRLQLAETYPDLRESLCKQTHLQDNRNTEIRLKERI